LHPPLSFCLYQFGIHVFIDSLDQGNHNNNDVISITTTSTTSFPQIIDTLESITYSTIKVLQDIQQQFHYQQSLLETDLFFIMNDNTFDETYFLSNGQYY
jgi:hypothetical protein